MNIALILAGGYGSRTEQDIPKQFINVYDKPIILYTLEAFQQHPDIDAIMVSCINGWQEILKSYAQQYQITKLKWIVQGGNTGQESTAKGVYALVDVCEGNDIIIVHDSIRPMVSQEIISDCIVKCRMYGSGLSAIRCQETIVRSADGIEGSEGIRREEIMRVQTPQAYRYKKLLSIYKKADQEGIKNEVYVNTLMLRFGEKVYFSTGSNKNIKITTAEDIEIFKAIYSLKREEWMK